MQENNFERKAQQRMEELNVSPSGAVWDKVYARIKKEKRRRRLIIWFFLFGVLLLGGGSAWWLSGKKDGHVAANHRIDENDRTENAVKQNSVAAEEEISKQKTKVANTQEQEPKENTSQTGKAKIDGGIDKQTSVKGFEIANEVARNLYSNNQVRTRRADKNRPSISDPVEYENPGLQTNADNDLRMKFRASDPIGKESVVINDRKNKLKISGMPSIKPLQNNIGQKPEIAKKVSEKNSKANKWQTGINAQVGFSNTIEANRLFWGQSFAELNYGSGSGGGGASYNPYHDVRSRLSFGLGVFTRKQLSKRFYLNIGMNYSLFRTGLRVGDRVNNSQTVSNPFSSNVYISGFFRPSVNDSGRMYINKYHFLGLQSEIGWRFSPWPLSLNLGLAYNRLLSTNALIYERSLPGFYQGKNAFRKNHLFISGGLSMPVINREKYSIELNPFAEGSFSRVFSGSDTTRLHYTNLGLRIRVILKK